MSLGFCVMLNQLAGDGGKTKEALDFSIGKIIRSASVEDDKLVIGFDGASIEISDSGQSCCERRYLTCDDDLEQFVGGVVVSVEEKEGPDQRDEYGDPHETTFIHVNTDRGSIVVCAHNEHNGYYGGFSLVAYLKKTQAEKLEAR